MPPRASARRIIPVHVDVCSGGRDWPSRGAAVAVILVTVPKRFPVNGPVRLLHRLRADSRRSRQGRTSSCWRIPSPGRHSIWTARGRLHPVPLAIPRAVSRRTAFHPDGIHSYYVAAPFSPMQCKLSVPGRSDDDCKLADQQKGIANDPDASTRLIDAGASVKRLDLGARDELKKLLENGRRLSPTHDRARHALP